MSAEPKPPVCDDFEARYHEALVSFCAAPDEQGRQRAYDLGRYASNRCELSMLAVIDIHHRVVASLLDLPASDVYKNAWAFLMELLMHYEMRLRGYQEANLRLVQRTAELVRAREEALSASRAKTEFLSNMSHELRTPLNSIIGFTEVLLAEESGLADRHKTFVSLVNSAGTHLLSMVEDLLDVGRIESGNMPVRPEDFDLDEVIDDVLCGIEPSAVRKGLYLRRHSACADPIRSDRRMLRQIIVNLLSNAVKFTTHGGVELSCQRVGGSVELAVADTGVGIDAALVKRLFQPFERLQAPQGVPGTGLGLYLCAQYVRALQGSIDVDTAPGKGTRFTVRLPVTPA